MSTNSDTMFSVTDDGRLTETPRCTRTSPCSKADCPFCNRPVYKYCVRNLFDDLEESNLCSRSNKPTAPTDHWINWQTNAFKDAILDPDMEYLEYLTDHYQLVTTTYQDFFDFDQRHL